MCGIAGIYNSTEDSKDLQNLAANLIKMLEHRGPDGNGYEVLQQKNNRRTLLAHTRLSIIDLSEDGSQPMTDSKGRFFITYNGEIYNHSELRKELENLGSTFRTRSDTEVIIESYKQWGLDGFNRFIGMWALALWDSVNQELILSRDRLGIKPLFFSEQDGVLAFGSEPKAVLESIKANPKLNHNAVSDYFSYRYVLGGGSFFSGVNSLEAGSHLICKNGQTKKIVYWTLPVIKNKEDFLESELQEELRSILSSSVSYRMISDVPFGSFLSGGLDSSILVSEMSRIQKDPIKTYTIGFKEKGFNEFKYANEVSEYLGTDHTETVLDADSYLEAMLKMISIKDAPLAVPNEIALHKMSQILKKDISVVLSGEGADELFGGYGRIFRSAYDFERMSGEPLSDGILRDNLVNKYKTLEITSELDHFLKQYSYVSKEEKDALFSPLILNSIEGDLENKRFFEPLWKNLDGLNLTEKFIWIFQKVHL
jgi:asparagine synthase (glutamine-hydrolysing)